LAAPLDEVVPEYVDIITLGISRQVLDEEGVDVVRWWPEQSAPDTIVEFRGEADFQRGWFAGLDSAGTWYALLDAYDVLSVLPVTALADNEGWLDPNLEVVGLRVANLAWHDTEPGQLAWVSCPRMQGSPGALYTLDVADHLAEPVLVAELPYACGSSEDAWLTDWGDWGFALERAGSWVGDSWEQGSGWTVFLDPDGGELGRLEHEVAGAVVVAGPAGSLVAEEAASGTPSWFLRSLDGKRRIALPDLAEGVWIDSAWWSFDGSRLAVVAAGTKDENLSVLILDPAAGEIIAEIDESGSSVWEARWSTDGRFLLYGRGAGGDGSAEATLVVYDTVTAAIAAEVPLPVDHGLEEIRSADPATITQPTPAHWGIDLDDAGPGVHTVFMIVDASSLVHEQIEETSGRLIWDETVVDLCGIGIRVNEGLALHIGDIFQTTEGCGSNPTAMQDAFDAYGLPTTACVTVAADGLDHEYCAPLASSESPP
jgi:hypothetical protein